MAWYETLLHASTYSFSALFSWINFSLVVGGGFNFLFFSGNVIENEFKLQFEHKTLKNSLVTCQTKGELKAQHVLLSDNFFLFCYSTRWWGLCIHWLCRHDIPFGAGQALWHSFRLSFFFMSFRLRTPTCVLVSGEFRIRPVWMTECWKLHDREILLLVFRFVWQK